MFTTTQTNKQHRINMRRGRNMPIFTECDDEKGAQACSPNLKYPN